MGIRATVGLNVIRFRRKIKISQEELALRSGLARAYLSGIEAGKRNPTVEALEKISLALGIEVEDLVRKDKV